MLAQSRLWGGLMAAGGLLLGLICLLWVFSTASTAGAYIFGLGFVLIVSLPLLVGGAFLFLRGGQEEQREQQVDARRRTLESESLSRAELADRLARQRDRLQSVHQAALPASDPTNRLLLEDAIARLDGVAGALRRTSYERVGAFDALAADASDPDTVRSIDAALDSSSRTLEQQVSALTQSIASGQPDAAAVNRLGGTISRLENATNERSSVLTAGEQKSLPSVAELLRGTQPTGVPDAAGFTNLKPNDALSYESEDYVVTGKLAWSEGATEWQTYLLGGGTEPLWLFVEQGGTSLAIMRPVPVPADAGNATITIEGAAWTLGGRGTATVSVAGASGSRGGLFVGYQRYQGNGPFLWVEEWDEGPKAYLGQPERAENLELWIR
ncbi:MAG: DUF4178 domain-containing protein [Chloroflexota bacterium]|nr:DUF4178 domain-containing protein [Chloroflexota bacterium]